MADKKLVNEIILMIKQNFSSSDILRQLREEGFTPNEIREGIDQAQTKIELAKAAGDESLAFAQEDFNEETFEEAPRPGSKKKMSRSIMPMPQEQESQEQASEEMPEEYYPEGQYGETEEKERKKPATPMPRMKQEYEYPEEQAISLSPAPMQEEGYGQPSTLSYQYTQPSINESDIDEMVQEIVNDKIREIEAKIGSLDSFKQSIEKQIKLTDENIKKFDSKMQEVNEGILSKMQEINLEINLMNSEVIALENAFLKILSPLVSNMKDINKIANEANKISFKKATNIEELDKKISESKAKRENISSKKKETERETLDKLLKRARK